MSGRNMEVIFFFNYDFFWTNMESNAAVMLQFENLAFKIYWFFKHACIC